MRKKRVKWKEADVEQRLDILKGDILLLYGLVVGIMFVLLVCL